MHMRRPNQVISAGHFYISHNTVDESIYGGETTALVWGQMQRFFILKGNHLAQYQELISQGWDACLNYYRNLPDEWHPNSDLLPCDLLPLPKAART